MNFYLLDNSNNVKNFAKNNETSNNIIFKGENTQVKLRPYLNNLSNKEHSWRLENAYVIKHRKKRDEYNRENPSFNFEKFNRDVLNEKSIFSYKNPNHNENKYEKDEEFKGQLSSMWKDGGKRCFDVEILDGKDPYKKSYRKINLSEYGKESKKELDLIGKKIRVDWTNKDFRISNNLVPLEKKHELGLKPVKQNMNLSNFENERYLNTTRKHFPILKNLNTSLRIFNFEDDYVVKRNQNRSLVYDWNKTGEYNIKSPLTQNQNIQNKHIDEIKYNYLNNRVSFENKNDWKEEFVCPEKNTINWKSTAFNPSVNASEIEKSDIRNKKRIMSQIYNNIPSSNQFFY